MYAIATANGSQELTLFAEDSPAKICLSPENARDLLASEAAYGMNSRELSARLGLNGLSSKTSPVCFRRTEGETWAPSSGRWLTWGMASPGGCLMLKGSEFPNDAAV